MDKENTEIDTNIQGQSDENHFQILQIAYLELLERTSRLKWAVVILSILLIALGVAVGFHKEQRIVMFDVRGTTNNFLDQVALLDITEPQKQAMVKRYQHHLTNIMKEYQDDGIIVLSSSAVVSQVEDKTDEIKKEISQRMKVK